MSLCACAVVVVVTEPDPVGSLEWVSECGGGGEDVSLASLSAATLSTASAGVGIRAWR